MRRPIFSLVAATALGCGPAATTSVISDADAALSRVRAAEGEKYAAYETTLADLYLAKAKEEQSHGHAAEAQELAAEAMKHATAAASKAAEHRAPPAAPATTATAREVVSPAPDAGTPR